MGMMKFASYRVTHNLLLGRWNYCFVESQVLFRICSSPQSSPADNCREQGWLLKKSVFLKKVENRVIENVQEAEKNRL